MSFRGKLCDGPETCQLISADAIINLLFPTLRTGLPYRNGPGLI